MVKVLRPPLVPREKVVKRKPQNVATQVDGQYSDKVERGSNEPRHEKTCLRSFRLDKTKTGMRSHRN